MGFKVSSAKCRPFCLVLNVLIKVFLTITAWRKQWQAINRTSEYRWYIVDALVNPTQIAPLTFKVVYTSISVPVVDPQLYRPAVSMKMVAGYQAVPVKVGMHGTCSVNKAESSAYRSIGSWEVC